MFDNNGYIHVDSPGAGADNPLGSTCFHKDKSSVNFGLPAFFPLNNCVTVFHVQAIDDQL